MVLRKIRLDRVFNGSETLANVNKSREYLQKMFLIIDWSQKKGGGKPQIIRG